MIKMYEDEQIKFQGFEDYVKYVAYDDDGEIDSFDDPYQAEELARESESGYADKVTYDYNGDEINREIWWGGYKVIAKQEYGNGSGVDDCYYDDILIFENDHFMTGSGHEYSSCTEYEDYANSLLDDDIWFNSTEEELDYVCDGMSKEFGGTWDYDTIRGSVQREYANIIYNKDVHNRDSIKHFANDYYNIGYYYNCYIDGEYEVSVWVNEMDSDSTLDIIADATGYNEDEIWIEEMY